MPEPGSVESARATGEVTSFNNELVRVNSVGNVVIEDDVEIGAGSCLDRATLGETRVGRGSKLDNLVQVGHNVTIGTNCLIVAQVGLGGSANVGHRVVLGGQSGVPDHLSIGDDALVLEQVRHYQYCAGEEYRYGFSRRIKTRLPRPTFEYQEAPENPERTQRSETTIQRPLTQKLELDCPHHRGEED